MPIFAVELTFDKDEERRLALRPSHREKLKELYDEGVLVMSGPFADDSGALLILRADGVGSVRQHATQVLRDLAAVK